MYFFIEFGNSQEIHTYVHILLNIYILFKIVLGKLQIFIN